ncbi:MAG: PH domain-containing protein [Flavobacteriaceae bacterium]
MSLTASSQEIYYGKFDSIVLSPKDKQKFAAALIKINADIQNTLE